MSANTSSITGKVSNFGTRAWLIILALSVAVFFANFTVTSYLSKQENNARKKHCSGRISIKTSPTITKTTRTSTIIL